MIIAILLVAVFWLAWSNGANDNFKGVATLYGSATCGYRPGLIWATVATVSGCLVSVFLAQTLIKAFSGKGLIPDPLLDSPMLAAIGASGAVTILLATFLGMPTSTTHALTGALVGAALVADPHGVNWHMLAFKFAQPLLLSPVLAVAITAVVYLILHRIRLGTNIEQQTCICIGEAAPQPVTVTGDGTVMLSSSRESQTVIQVGETDRCVERYMGRLVGIDAQAAVNVVHYASGAAVCFARAVNDTPKIAPLLLAGGAAGISMNSIGALLLVAAAMAAGGLLQARRVAETMSKRITDLNCGQGLTANLVTAALVLGASRLGMPVSTTHVSCGSIFGIGLVNRRRRWRTVAQILATWATTLPLGMALGAGFSWAFHQLSV